MNLGFGELLLIFIVILLIFGASKQPALGNATGRSIENIKRSVSGENEIDVTPKKDELGNEKVAQSLFQQKAAAEKK